MRSSLLLLFSVFFAQYVYTWSQPNNFGRYGCPSVRLNNGKVRVRARGRIMRFDCYSGYTLVGNRYTSCIHGEWDVPTPVCVSTRCTPPPTPPHALVASKLNGGMLIFFCEPGYSLQGSDEIYCDGRYWNTTTPTCIDLKVPLPTSCDFETDSCMWERDPFQDLNWERRNFGTVPSRHISTGPTFDHTLGVGNNGHYLYTEASGPLENDTATIISPLYNSSLTESGCFSFWYHMYGNSNVGTLNVYFKEETNNTRILKFTRKGDQGHQWWQGIFDLPKTNISFQIIIEGIRYKSYVSNIAVDDVAILQGDECNVKNNSDTANVTASNDDQIEIVNAQETCRDRCVYSLEETVYTTPKFGVAICYCTLDCMAESMCCPDYDEYCTAGFTATEPDRSITSPNETLPTTTRQVTRTTWKVYVQENTSAPTRKPGNDSTRYYMNAKDYIDPSTLSLSSTTTQKSSMTTRLVTRTTKFPKQTTTLATTTTPRKNYTWKTLRPTIFTTRYEELQDQSGLHSENQNPEKVKHAGRFAPLLVGIVSTTVIVFSLTLVITIVIIKRRKACKRGSNSALSEDSDVRFLTSDEILDFNLARPAENEEQ